MGITNVVQLRAGVPKKFTLSEASIAYMSHVLYHKAFVLCYLLAICRQALPTAEFLINLQYNN